MNEPLIHPRRRSPILLCLLAIGVLSCTVFGSKHVLLWMFDGRAEAALIFSRSSSAAGGQRYPILAPCERIPELFPHRPTGSHLINWREKFRETMNEVVEAHMETGSGSTSASCEGETPGLNPTEELKNLAKKLPPWKDPADLRDLRGDDTGAVLLEYLRAYECALKEREIFLLPSVFEEVKLQKGGTLSTGDLRVGPIARQQVKELDLIREEMTIVPRAVHRTIRYISGHERLRPLYTNLMCLQRASLDIRNVIGLAADASACLPRAWDARNPLRDLAE